MLTLTNAKENFSMARDSLRGVNTLECEIYHQLARIIPDETDIDTLILGFKIILNDFKNRNDFTPATLVPKYIRQIASPEFAKEFRHRYNSEVLGMTPPPLPNVNYGCKEIEKDVIDISHKDKYEVLAALYNQAVPIGVGYGQYDSTIWNKEMAKMYFESSKKKNEETVYLSWIFGRPLMLKFTGNLLYVGGYNREQEDNLAQRVIATCKNIDKKNTDAPQKRKK